MNFYFKGIREHYFIKNKTNTLAILEIVPSMHSQFGPFWQIILPGTTCPQKGLMFLFKFLCYNIP